MGDNELMRWQDPDHHEASYIGVMTGWGASGVASVTPKAGRVCFFRHGEEMCEHEGEEIFAGKKIVLRSDVFKLVDE